MKKNLWTNGEKWELRQLELLLSRKTKKRNKNSLLWPLWLISREETACYIREEVHPECFLGFFLYGELQSKVIGVTKSVWYPNVMLLDNKKHKKKKKITRCTHSKPVVIPLEQDTKTWNSNLNKRDSSFPHLRDQVAGGCRIHPEGCPGSEWRGWCWFWRHQTGHQHWLAWAQNHNTTHTHTHTYNQSLEKQLTAHLTRAFNVYLHSRSLSLLSWWQDGGVVIIWYAASCSAHTHIHTGTDTIPPPHGWPSSPAQRLCGHLMSEPKHNWIYANVISVWDSW